MELHDSHMELGARVIEYCYRVITHFATNGLTEDKHLDVNMTATTLRSLAASQRHKHNTTNTTDQLFDVGLNQFWGCVIALVRNSSISTDAGAHDYATEITAVHLNMQRIFQACKQGAILPLGASVPSRHTAP